MTLTPITPKKAINKAYLKERINRADMEQFKTHFKLLLDRIFAIVFLIFSTKSSIFNLKYKEQHVYSI